MTKPFALIVEDDRDIAEIFNLSLEGAGFVTEVVRDGQVAFERLAEIVPDVVVLDIHLPGIPGNDILKFIRSNERLAETQVMLVTADAARGEELRGESDLLLLKPVSPLQLRTLASRLIS
ncbi:MAG: Polar-differentiation response regulator DivK [Chloroflexi bacterium]|nr:Polar-differentiation response regulator DivK [Chloroflexota bacterium]